MPIFKFYAAERTDVYRASARPTTYLFFLLVPPTVSTSLPTVCMPALVTTRIRALVYLGTITHIANPHPHPHHTHTHTHKHRMPVGHRMHSESQPPFSARSLPSQASYLPRSIRSWPHGPSHPPPLTLQPERPPEYAFGLEACHRDGEPPRPAPEPLPPPGGPVNRRAHHLGPLTAAGSGSGIPDQHSTDGVGNRPPSRPGQAATHHG